MDEARVVRKVLGGNVEVYDILVKKYAALLAGTARHLICNVDDAEDLAQETLLDAYRNLSTLRDHASYRAWIFGILRLKCRDYLRRRKPEALNLDEYAEIIPAPIQEDTGDLMELLNTLPLQDREVLAARYIQDLDYKDIAETLEISEEAVRMRCSRARSRFRAINEQRMRQAMGAFTILPLSKGFTNRVMQRARQMQAAPSAGGSLLLTGGSLKIAAWLGILAVGIGVSLFCLFKPKPVGSQVDSPTKSLQYQTNIQKRSGQMEPKIITKKEMILVGLSSDRSDICGLWTKYSEKEKDIKHKVEGAGYELHRFLKDSIEVTVATEVTQAEAIPEGMSVIHVPAGQYAVFTHRLANGGYEGLNPVMNKWLTTGAYEQADNISIQVFDERFKGGNQPDSEIDFLIPIRPRT